MDSAGSTAVARSTDRMTALMMSQAMAEARFNCPGCNPPPYLGWFGGLLS